MRFIRRSLALFFLLSAFGIAQYQNLDTQVKGSRPPSFATDSGSANAYVLTTVAPLGPGLRNGSVFTFLAAHTNTGASTADVDVTGAKTIKKWATGTLVDLTAGDITAGQIVALSYDGTYYQFGAGGGGGSGGGSGSGCPLSNGTSLKTANYTITGTDAGFLMLFNGSSLTATLPATPPSATWCVSIWNQHSSNLTVSRNGLLINTGSTNIVLKQYQLITCWTDTTNYVCTRPLIASSGASVTESSDGEYVSASGTLGGSNPGTVLCDTGIITDTITSAGNFANTCTLAANTLSYNSEIYIWAAGTEHIVSGDDHFFGLLDGSTQLFSQTGHSVAVGDYDWSWKGQISVATAGAAGHSILAVGSGESYTWQENGGGNGIHGYSTGFVSFDTTAAHTLKIKVTNFQTGSTATMKRLVVIQVN